MTQAKRHAWLTLGLCTAFYGASALFAAMFIAKIMGSMRVRRVHCGYC